MGHTFQANEVMLAIPHVEMRLRKAFAVMADILANQAFAFADTSLYQLCRRQIDGTMNSLQFSIEQEQALCGRHSEINAVMEKAEECLKVVGRCLLGLRNLSGHTARVKPAKKV